jgi:hypothetical protein
MRYLVLVSKSLECNLSEQVHLQVYDGIRFWQLHYQRSNITGCIGMCHVLTVFTFTKSVGGVPFLFLASYGLTGQLRPNTHIAPLPNS